MRQSVAAFCGVAYATPVRITTSSRLSMRKLLSAGVTSAKVGRFPGVTAARSVSISSKSAEIYSLSGTGEHTSGVAFISTSAISI